MNYKDRVLLEVANVLDTWLFEPGSVNQIVFSPPYWRARDYGVPDQLGTESLHDCLAWARGEEPVRGCCYICHVRLYARQAHRVLHDSGTMTINISDTYAGSGKGTTDGQSKKNRGSVTAVHLKTGTPGGLKRKDKAGIPQRVALALQADGWFWRAEVPWVKMSGMPSNYKDRPLATHEQILIFSKKPRYFWDAFSTLVPARGSTDYEPARYGGAARMADLDSADNTLRRTTDWIEDQLRLAVKHHADMTAHLLNLLETSGHLADLEGNLLFIRTPNGGNRADHFAGYHPEMIRPIIQAGTSSFGVCANCLSPYKRLVTREVTGRERRVRSQLQIGSEEMKHVSQEMAEYKLWHTSGWERTCKCDCDEIKRPVVLDPFLGSGTTMRVSLEEGCDFIGFDVSPDYIAYCNQWLNSLEVAPVIKDESEYNFGLFAQTGDIT